MKVSIHTLLHASFWLLAVLTEHVSHATSESRADQYDARHGTPPLPLLQPVASSHSHREATDHPPRELHANPVRNHDNDRVKLSLIGDSNGENQDQEENEKQNSVMTTNELGEMQVGCGQGLFEVVPAPKRQNHKREARKLIRKRAIENMRDRRKRNYHGTFTVWQPPVYQLTRPYVIPVWGAQGQVPIYFPPQPIPPNPLDDPRKSYLPPKGYLPPTRTTTIGYDDDDDEDISNAQGNDGNVDLNNRNNFDDAPIWDIEPIQSRPPQTRPPIRTTPAPSGFVPPNRTRRPGSKTTTFPPLVHRSENNSNPIEQGANSLRPVQNRPNVVEVPNFRPSQGGNSFGGFAPSTQRPRPVQYPTTSVPPPPQPSRAQPSRCVWAIISCCQGNNQNISYSCFEQLGCTGAFWDKSPCDSDFAKAAVDIALQYYSQK